ncbi:acyltransferase family protein [Patulibacter defluvii]|uniref:acyltransferase family protein n=1 Tax=Patulibacter defluvii TaxID=3095358 RepID=UPI002A7634BD|nr:acyltransferase [Patulibacter sp. DM4]
MLDPSRRHAPALDGLRALAALLVIALHVGIYSGQVASSWLGIGEGGALGPLLSRFTVGVPIFFVLSGLLLYRPFADAALDGRSAPSALVYLWHRALRILPAYWLVAIVALVAFGSLGGWPTLRTLLLLGIYEPNGLPLGITQTWSLATEVAFYVLLPLLAIGLGRLARRPRGPLAIFLLLEAVTVVAIVLSHRAAAGDYPLAHLWLPEYLGYFGVGIALATWSARQARGGRPGPLTAALGRAPWLGWAVAVAAYVVVSTPLTGSTARYPSIGEALLEHALYLLIAAALVLPLLVAPGRGPSRLLSTAVPRALGRISYGLFLWHMVIVEAWLRLVDQTAGTADFAVLFPVAVVGATVAATASYRLVERPLRRLRPLPERLLARRTAGGLGEPAAAAVATGAER